MFMCHDQFDPTEVILRQSFPKLIPDATPVLHI